MLNKEFIPIIKDAIFKSEVMGIPQYIADGIYIEGIRIDIEHKYCIVEQKISVTRNRLLIYHESVNRFKHDYYGVEDL